MKYIKLKFSRKAIAYDGYNLDYYELTDTKGQDEETAIYYYVYENDFFERYPQRCTIALEKGDLEDEKYKEKCAELGVYNTEPTDIVAKEVTEKTVYIEYTDENVAKLAAIYALGDDVTIEKYVDYVKQIIKNHYNRKLEEKNPYETSDGIVIDFGVKYINNLEHIVKVMEDSFQFRIYDNSFVVIDKDKATQWLNELITHEIHLRNELWSYLDRLEKSETYQDVETIRRSVFSGDISN